MPEVGRQQRLRLKLTQRIAAQHITDRDRHIPSTLPDGGLGVDFDFALLPPVPVFNLNLRPLRFRIVESLLWRRSDFPAAGETSNYILSPTMLNLQDTVFRKPRSASLTSAGRSICAQCPAPSINTLLRMSDTHLSI
jgi:hypothetical protein